MFSLPGRNGRRRRVLNEEVLSASSSHVALRAMADDREASHDAPRYSDAAGVENHPQVTDFVPRRYSTIAVLVLAGVLTTAALGALHYFAMPIAAASGFADIGLLAMSAPGSLATWIAAVVLLIIAVMCLLVYSIRRHRIDDYRGRYRIWLAAAAACVLASADSVVGLHDALAQTLSHHTGWAALRAGAIWWLAIAGLPLSWIAVRVLVDIKECRVAAALLLAGIAGCVAAGASFLGLIPASDLRIETLTTGAASLVGNWLLLAGVASYARFVVLDVQGLVPVVRRTVKPAKSIKSTARAAKPASPSSKLATSIFAAAGRQRPATLSDLPPAKSPASAAEWTDGRRAERDEYDEDSDDEGSDDHKLSKSQRKRLRKLKARNRAA
jgi:hypothetical protein